MFGYSKYWTCGADASEWKAISNPKAHNWVDFTFINLWIDYDRKMREWTIEAHLLGLRAWVCFGWDGPDE